MRNEGNEIHFHFHMQHIHSLRGNKEEKYEKPPISDFRCIYAALLGCISYLLLIVTTFLQLLARTQLRSHLQYYCAVSIYLRELNQ